jgi:thiol-disulfide isomerase/thioredoxin
MKLTNKTKSNIVFWGIASVLLFVLFFTNAGTSFQSWIQSFSLSTPNVESSKVESLDEQFIAVDWMVISDQAHELWISEIDKPIFLNIWATWCGPCRSEMSSIMELQKEIGDKVEFLLVSTTETREKISQYRLSKEIDFPLYVNGSQIPQNLYATTFPTTFIIDKHKHIVHKWVGAYNWNDMEIKELLRTLSEE